MVPFVSNYDSEFRTMENQAKLVSQILKPNLNHNINISLPHLQKLRTVELGIDRAKAVAEYIYEINLFEKLFFFYFDLLGHVQFPFHLAAWSITVIFQ